MSVLIDPPLWPAHGRLWSHLVSDTSLEELHAFARAVGLPERGFEGDHYDVPDDRYAELIRAGAHAVGTRELLKRLQLSGLRRPKRRGERILASSVDPQGLRIDTVRSALAPPLVPATAWVVLQTGDTFLAGAADALLPRVPVAADDLDSGRETIDATFPTTFPATSGLARLGYLRHGVGQVGSGGPFVYDSALHLRFDRPSVAEPPWVWRPVEEVIAAESGELRPLLTLLRGR